MRRLRYFYALILLAIFFMVGGNGVAAKEPVIADLSHHQGKIDWATASKNLDFVIIRTQYGSTTEDRWHSKNEQAAIKYGIPFGVYAYALYWDEQDAQQEAKDFYNRASKSTKFYVVDVEEVTVKSGTTYNATKAFITQLKKLTNKPVGLYSGNYFYKNQNLKKVTNADFLWIARYSSNQPTVDYDLWQYTSQGSVLGITGDVDLNRLASGKTLNTFFRDDSAVTPASKPRYYTTNPGTVATKVQVNQYSSTSFTSATKGKAIAKNTLVKVAGIVKTSAGTPRLKLTNGTYMTANLDYVVKVTSKINQYYTKKPSKVLVKSGLYAYNNADLDSRVTGVKKNTVLRIKDLAYSSGGTPRLKLSNGYYITANKDFVRAVTSSIANYIYVNPGKVQLKRSVYQYSSPNMSSATRKSALSRGKTYTVKSISFSSGGTPRLKLSNGNYITANKNYVVAK